MGDSQDTLRSLHVHTSIRGLPKDWRRRPGRPRHTWLRTLEETFIRSTTDSTQHGDLPRTEDDGGNLWKRLRSSQGLASDDDDDDDDDGDDVIRHSSIVGLKRSAGRSRKMYHRYCLPV